MKKTLLMFVLLLVFAALISTSGVASAIYISPMYVGNTMVDLSWDEYRDTDFAKYELCRDGVPIKTITNRSLTFYRDSELPKGITYDYEIRVYGATGVLEDSRATKATTGEVRGTITQDTTWTAASSPYALTGSVRVCNGATLTIASGVMVTSIATRSHYFHAAIIVREKEALYADGVSFCNVSIKVHGSHAEIKNSFFESTYAYIGLDNSNNIKLTSNINGSIRLRDGSSNNLISDNTACDISLLHSDNNTITDNIVSNNSWGIHLNGSNNVISNNTVSNNSGGPGICVYLGSNDTITGNIVSNNSGGIYFNGYNHVISNNTVSNNSGEGICLGSYSNDNTIYNNYFSNINNSYNSVGNNTWNITKTAGTNIVGGPYLGGNYWSDYDGTDLDGDKLGDTLLPYNCSGRIENGGDYHPLIKSIIRVSASPEELPANGTSKSLVTAIVANQTGPVVGVDVSFSLDNTTLGKLEPLTAKTNDSGIATSNFTAGTIPGVVNVTANESKTHASDSVKIILGMIEINHTSSTSKFIPTPCRNATINFEIKPALLRDNPETNVSMIIRDKNRKLVYNSSEDQNAQVNNTTAIWTGKNATGEHVDPRLSNYTVKILVKYRNMTVNDTYNVTILPNKVIVVVDEERMKALYNDAKVDKLMANLTDYCCRNNGTLYNLTKVRHDFNDDTGYDDAFTYRQLHQWLHYPPYVERRLENVTKFMIQNNNVSILLVGNDNVTPYHRMSAILPHTWGGVECGMEGGYSYVPGNILWSDFPYSEITGDNTLDVPVTRLEGNPEVMMVQLESTKMQYRGTKALLAIKRGRHPTRINHNTLRNNLINKWGFGANVSYYNETQGPNVSITDKRIGGLSYLDRFDDDNVVMYAAAHGNDYKVHGQNVQRLSDDSHKIFFYPNNVSLGASHPLFVTKACHGACTYPGDTNTTSIPIALLADGAVGFVGWRAYGLTIQGADFFTNYYFPELRVKNEVGDALRDAKNSYLVTNGNNNASLFIARSANHYGIPDYIVHVPNDPSDKGYNLTVDTFEDTTTIDMELFSYAQSTVETEQGNRTLFTISGAHVLDNQGDYVIPVIVEIIATLPPTLDLEQLLSITKSDMETITNIELPVAVWLIEKDDTPYGYSGESLNLPGLYPSEVIDYEVIEKVDGKRTVYFRIFPFQYNDNANEMYVYRNITFGFVTGPAKPKPPVRLLVTNDFEREVAAGASTAVGMFIDNYGTGAAKNVNVTEKIADDFNVTFVSAGGTFNTATNIITWEIQNIGSEDFKMLNYELVAPQTTGNYTINTIIEYTDENGTVYPVINISKSITITVSGKKTIYVDDDFTDDLANHKWNTIQKGINDATDGDTVLVYNGTYTETVDVNKTLTLLGEGMPKIDAQSLGDAINITVDNCTVKGFCCVNAQPSPYAGIYVKSSNNVIVENTCRDNYDGIYLSGTSNEIRNNIANYNDHHGIKLQSSCENIIADNTAKNNGNNGIYLTSSDNNRITCNDASNNVKYHGISLYSSNNNEIRNNVANYNHYDGIKLRVSSENILANNTAKNNGNNGIYLKESKNNRIANNIANYNKRGIRLYNYSTGNIVANNTATANNYGISVVRSSNNDIYLNNFVDNTHNAYSSNSSNIWHSTSEITYTYNTNTYRDSLGNYWSDYKGSDTDGDGIGGSHYSIDGDEDISPLMKPWENYFQEYI